MHCAISLWSGVELGCGSGQGSRVLLELSLMRANWPESENSLTLKQRVAGNRGSQCVVMTPAESVAGN